MMMIHLHKNPVKKLFLIFVILLIPVVTIANSPAMSNDDFIIILDRSGSMREIVPGKPEFGYKKTENQSEAYKVIGTIDAINGVADNVLTAEDHFTVITFGDRPDIFLSQRIEYEYEREVIKRHMEKVLFSDQRTDIVASLVEAKDLIKSLKTPEQRKILIMITDGVNDPPPNSDYFTPDAQQKAYEELRDTIRADKWEVFLVGLGKDTRNNINEIADRLGLASERAKIVENLENSKEITDKLKDIFKWAKEGRVEAGKKDIRLKLKPMLFGGYEAGEDSSLLTSSYRMEVEINLNSEPVITKIDGLKINVNPLYLKLSYNQTGKLNFVISYKGKRPENGMIKGNYSFRFSEGSIRFYPHNGNFEITLPSWWEVYGIYAFISVILILIMLNFIWWLIRRAQVPEIRISVTANGVSLGDPMTLRKRQSFMIANGYFEGNSVAAKGLSCKIAAKVKYLGRRKFEITADEAKIVDEGKEYDRLQVGMDGFFDLKDKDGKTLRMIAINKPGKDDVFGGGYGNDDL